MSVPGFKVALVAGEASSDLLGAALIESLQTLSPTIRILAVGGEKIKATGVELLADNEVFSVMGLAEVLKDLPQIMKAKKQTLQAITAFAPDVFIGVDSPDLNFSLAKGLKKQGIKVMHYVSPSVWAWRPKRVFKMARFIDGLLTLFPFEVELYNKTSITAEFVGHPLAQKIPLQVDKHQAKTKLGLANKKILALLPGSRKREINTLMPVFAETIKSLKLDSEWQIISANVSAAKIAQVQAIAQTHQLDIHWVDDASDALMAADFALLGSGTVALEAMLCKTPMVVAYHISPLTWWIVKTFRMMQLPYYSLPNVLHQGFLVPEVMQQALNPNNLAKACTEVMAKPAEAWVDEFTRIHQTLLPDDPQQAGKAVLRFLESSC